MDEEVSSPSSATLSCWIDKTRCIKHERFPFCMDKILVVLQTSYQTSNELGISAAYLTIEWNQEETSGPPQPWFTIKNCLAALRHERSVPLYYSASTLLRYMYSTRCYVQYITSRYVTWRNVLQIRSVPLSYSTINYFQENVGVRFLAESFSRSDVTSRVQHKMSRWVTVRQFTLRAVCSLVLPEDLCLFSYREFIQSWSNLDR